MVTFKRALFVALVGVVAVGASGCSAINKAKKAAAKEMGVKVTTRAVKIGDLDPAYSKLENTENDVLSAKSTAPTKKEVKYKRFGVKSLDDYLKESNEMYASYVVADMLVDKSITDLNTFVGADVYTLADEKEIIKALRAKSPDQLTAMQKLEENKGNVEMLVSSVTGIAGKAMGVKDKGVGMSSSIAGEFQKDPAKALVADEAVKEIKTSIDRMTKVVTGAPDLVAKMGKLTTTAGIVTSAASKIASGQIPEATGGGAKAGGAKAGGKSGNTNTPGKTPAAGGAKRPPPRAPAAKK